MLPSGVVRYVDTHCNIPNILQKLCCSSFSALRQQHFPPSFEACLSVASDAASQTETLRLAHSEEKLFAALGIHPLYAKEYTTECEQHLLEAMKSSKVRAWGEIGLDYHNFGPEYNYAEPSLQKTIFRKQMEHALQLKKPIVIHTREAEEDTLALMKQYIPRDWKIHVHCFTDSLKFAEKLMTEYEQLFLGFTGVITFKNAKVLQEVVKQVPLERLLLETDGPFMAPVPFRGKVCHPGHIPLIAEKVAELKGVPVEDVYRAARENTTKMYNI